MLIKFVVSVGYAHEKRSSDSARVGIFLKRAAVPGHRLFSGQACAVLVIPPTALGHFTRSFLSWSKASNKVGGLVLNFMRGEQTEEG